MRVVAGRSGHEAGAAAVQEATASWGDTVPEVIFAFASTRQDPDQVAAALRERFPESLVVGCTTSGESLDGGHHRGQLVLSGLVDTGIRWSVALVPALSKTSFEAVDVVVDGLFTAQGTERGEVAPDDWFCVSFFDGLSLAEERVSSWIADALEGVRQVGGSAGDDLAFTATRVFHGGRAHADAAVLLLGHAEARNFEVIKHQHFTVTGRQLAVTRCEPEIRRIVELDGRPAIEAYADVLGLSPEDVTPEVCFANPLTLSIHGTPYVRSIREVLSDGSIDFYCAVEEGMVLDVGNHLDMPTSLASALADREPASFMLMCNCILRALEAEAEGLHAAVGAIVAEHAEHVLGFDTYGEQVDGLHINQTFVALALRPSEEAA